MELEYGLVISLDTFRPGTELGKVFEVPDCKLPDEVAEVGEETNFPCVLELENCRWKSLHYVGVLVMDLERHDNELVVQAMAVSRNVLVQAMVAERSADRVLELEMEHESDSDVVVENSHRLHIYIDE